MKLCSVCGREIPSPKEGCAFCPPKHHISNAEPGSYGITGHPVGTVVEGPPDNPEGRRVDSRPASGGQSFSTIDHTGAFEADLKGPLDRGRSNERGILKILVQALRQRGDDAKILPGHRDDRGEDGRLSINGESVVIQIVSLPTDPDLWKNLSMRGGASRKGTPEDAVQMVRQALEHKKGKAAGTFLVLDAAHIAAIVGPRIVRDYHTAHGNPEKEFGLVEAWIIGPTVRSSIRLVLEAL